MTRRIRSLLPATLAGLALALAGCGTDTNGGRPRTYPVSGRVVVKDAKKGTTVPADGARIDFVPVGEKLSGHGKDHAGAVVDAEGRFRLTTYKPDDGAPAGNYAVLVTWAKGSGERGGADALRGKYSNASSPLLKAEVKADEANEFVFELTP
jgi:hypothetical protein